MALCAQHPGSWAPLRPPAPELPLRWTRRREPTAWHGEDWTGPLCSVVTAADVRRGAGVQPGNRSGKELCDGQLCAGIDWPLVPPPSGGPSPAAADTAGDPDRGPESSLGERDGLRRPGVLTPQGPACHRWRWAAALLRLSLGVGGVGKGGAHLEKRQRGGRGLSALGERSRQWKRHVSKANSGWGRGLTIPFCTLKPSWYLRSGRLMRTVVTGGQLTMLSFTCVWFFSPCRRDGPGLSGAACPSSPHRRPPAPCPSAPPSSRLPGRAPSPRAGPHLLAVLRVGEVHEVVVVHLLRADEVAVLLLAQVLGVDAVGAQELLVGHAEGLADGLCDELGLRGGRLRGRGAGHGAREPEGNGDPPRPPGPSAGTSSTDRQGRAQRQQRATLTGYPLTTTVTTASSPSPHPSEGTRALGVPHPSPGSEPGAEGPRDPGMARPGLTPEPTEAQPSEARTHPPHGVSACSLPPGGHPASLCCGSSLSPALRSPVPTGVGLEPRSQGPPLPGAGRAAAWARHLHLQLASLPGGPGSRAPGVPAPPQGLRVLPAQTLRPASPGRHLGSCGVSPHPTKGVPAPPALRRTALATAAPTSPYPYPCGGTGAPPPRAPASAPPPSPVAALTSSDSNTWQIILYCFWPSGAPGVVSMQSCEAARGMRRRAMSTTMLPMSAM